MAARQGYEGCGKPGGPVARRGVLKAGLAIGAVVRTAPLSKFDSTLEAITEPFVLSKLLRDS